MRALWGLGLLLVAAAAYSQDMISSGAAPVTGASISPATVNATTVNAGTVDAGASQVGGCYMISGTIYCPVGKFDELDAGTLMVNGPSALQGLTATTVQGTGQIGTTAGLDAGYALINGQLNALGHIYSQDDIHVTTGNSVYLNGTTRTVGFAASGTDIVAATATTLRPAGDQGANLGTATVSWSDAFVYDYHLHSGSRMISNTAPTVAACSG